MAGKEEIKGALDIVDLISETVDLTDCGGDEWKGAISPGSQSGKSLNVNRSMQVWHDWPSDTGGDVFNWIAHINNLDNTKDFKKILSIAADKAGVELDTYNGNTHNSEIHTILKACMQWYHDKLTTDHRAYIKAKWGLADTTIDKYLIGYAPAGTDLQQALSQVFTIDLIQSSGLFQVSGGGWVPIYQDRIVFPYWQSGQVVYSIARSMEDNTKNKYLKHLTKGSIKNVIFGQDSLKGADHCIITEGVTDCLMVLQAGIPCVSPVTVQFQKDDHAQIIELVKDLKIVYICNDNEVSGAGDKGARATAELLQSKGVNVSIIQLPKPEGVDKIDLADYLRDNSIDNFKELMKAAARTPQDDPDKPCKDCRYHRDGTNDKGLEWARCALYDVWLNPYRLQSCVDWEAMPEVPPAAPREKSPKGLYFDDKTKFISKILGDEILQQHKIITLADTRQLLLYLDGVFKPDAEDTIKQICMQKLGDDYKRDRTNETIEYIRLNTLTDRDELNINTYLINVKNGMVDVINEDILPHDPKYKSSVQFNVRYDPDAQCTAIDKFLNEVTAPEFVPLLYQYIGYCLTPDTSLQKALVLDGGTGNGKSVFIDLVTALIGKKYSSVQSIQRLNNNRFATAALDGKMINVFTDMPSEKLRDNSVFKMVTGDKTISAEIKGGRCYEFKNTCHHVYATNQLPELENMEEMAFFRRLLCVSFPNTFNGNTADKHLLDKLTTETELSGLFNIALIGLRFLIEHEEFCFNPTIEKIQQQYLIKSNPVVYFLETCTESGQGSITKEKLHETYTKWCRVSKPTSVLSDNAFGRALTNLGYSSGRSNEDKRPRTWNNISLSTESNIWLNFSGPGYNPCPGLDQDNKKTWTFKNQQTNDDNMSSCPGSQVISYFLEYNRIYTYMYSSTVSASRSEEKPGHLDMKKEKQRQEALKEQSRIENNPDKQGSKPGQDLDSSQVERLKSINTAVTIFEKLNGPLSSDNYKAFASNYVQNTDFDYDQVLTDLRHGWNISDNGTNDMVVIRLHKDVPQFQAVNDVVYNLNENDVVSLPRSNATVFINRGLATAVNVGGET